MDVLLLIGYTTTIFAIGITAVNFQTMKIRNHQDKINRMYFDRLYLKRYK